MEEELRVIVSTPSGNDCPRPGVVPFDANSSHFALSIVKDFKYFCKDSLGLGLGEIQEKKGWR